MSKIICDVCGTSYADTASQCPICGTARPVEMTAGTDGSDQAEYTYVKGGRFSKGNVRKRNVESGNDNAGRGTKTGLIIVLVALIFVVITIIAFIVMKTLPSGDVNVPTIPTDVIHNPCQAIILPNREVALTNVGDVFLLNVKKSPANSTDALFFDSSDTGVVTVTAEGKLEAISEGTAVITITCGTVKIACQVTVGDGAQKVELVLNRQEITFYEEGETWLVYSGEIAAEDIVWRSDDETVAVVNEGLIVAVGEGQTTIFAEYDGVTVSCPVICEFSEEEPSLPGGITEDMGGIGEDQGGIGEDHGGIGEDNGDVGGDVANTTEIKLYTTYGAAPYNSYINSYDVTIKVGERLSFYLKDNGGTLAGVVWSLPAGNSCCWIGDAANDTDNVVKGLQPGNVTLSGSYGGQTFKCYIRVSN